MLWLGGIQSCPLQGSADCFNLLWNRRALALERDLRVHLAHHPYFADEVFDVSRAGVVCPMSQLANSGTGTRIKAF